MTFNSKALSLLLLSSIAMGALAEGSRRSQCDCDKKERVACKETCCNKGICKKDCKADKPTLAFECCLSYEQTVASDGFARTKQDKPEGVCGKFHICFAPDFSKAEYKLTITGVDTNKPNQIPVGAFLCLGTPATNPVLEKASPSLATLCSLADNGNSGCTVNKNFPKDFCCKGTIDNETLRKTVENPEDVFFITTVAALYQAIRSGVVFVQVNGSNDCNQFINYGQNAGGLLRCQILGTGVAGNIDEIPNQPNPPQV